MPEYLAMLRRMTGAQKLRTAFQLYWGARKIKAARLCQQHPEWSEKAGAVDFQAWTRLNRFSSRSLLPIRAVGGPHNCSITSRMK
jgi:hypothetical protein